MRTARLIAASFRLAWSPSSRPVILCLIVFSLLLPLITAFFVPKPVESLPSASISLVSDETDNDLLDTLQSEFQKIDLVDTVYIDSLQDAAARLENGETLLYMDFPDGFFVDSITAMKREPVEIVLNEDMPVEGEYFARMADEITVTLVELESAYFAYADLLRPFFATPEALQNHLDLTLFAFLMRLLTRNRLVTSLDAPQFDIVAFVAASLLVVLVLFAGLLPLFFTSRDDKLGVSARFLASGFSDWQIQAARLLSGLPFVLLVMVPLFVVAVTVYGFALTWPTVLAALLLYTVQALLSMLAARIGTRSVAPVLLAFGLMFVHMLFGGVIYPEELLPRAVVSFGQYLPAAAAHRVAFTTFAEYQAGVTLTPLLYAVPVLALLLVITGPRRRRLA